MHSLVACAFSCPIRDPHPKLYEEHGILLYRRDRTMVAYGKIHCEA